MITMLEPEDFYSAEAVTHEDCNDMGVPYNSKDKADGAFAEKAPEGVRISLKSRRAKEAVFYFPELRGAKSTDWSGAKYAEIHIRNESTFGTRIAFVITQSSGEKFMLTNGTAVCLGYPDGEYTKAEVFWESVWIPGNFDGIVYIPMDEKSLWAVPWALAAGLLDITKITGLSYMLLEQDSRPIDSCFLIKEVRKTAFDPAPFAKDTYKKLPLAGISAYDFPECIAGMKAISMA